MKVFVSGTPHSERSGTRPAGLKDWKQTLHAALSNRRVISSTCEARIDFLLPPDLFQEGNTQNPNGPDLDNLVEPVLDALASTILRPAGGDGAIVKLLVTKRSSRGREKPGVNITLRALQTRRHRHSTK